MRGILTHASDTASVGRVPPRRQSGILRVTVWMTQARALAIVAALLVTGFRPPAAARFEPVRAEASRSRWAASDIVAFGPDRGVVSTAAEQALDEVDRIDRLMSHYRPDSPLSRLNRRRPARPCAVDAELFDFIAESIDYSRESDGAFDITVGPPDEGVGILPGRGPRADRPRARGRAAPRRLPARRPRPGRANRSASTCPASSSISAGSPRATPSIAWSTCCDGGSRGRAGQRGRQHRLRHGRATGADAWQVDAPGSACAGAIAFTAALRDRALPWRDVREVLRGGTARYAHIMDPRTRQARVAASSALRCSPPPARPAMR